MLTPFGKECRRLRVESFMTLKDLADKLGVSPSYVSSLETGRIDITDEILNKIIRILAKSDSDADSLRNAKNTNITNGDHIRRMNNEELAIMFINMCLGCQLSRVSRPVGNTYNNKVLDFHFPCDQQILNWLNFPYKGGL